MEAFGNALKPAVARSGLQIRIIKAPFPEYFKNSLDSVHRNVFCSLACHLTESNDVPVFAYVTSIGQVITQIILFSQELCVLRVLNEIFKITKCDIERFVAYMFDNYSHIEVIKFASINVAPVQFPYPCQRHNSTENIVIKLPHSTEIYLSQLSKNTRESVRRYQKKIAREYPDLEFKALERNQVTPDQIGEIIHLSRARIVGKKRIPTHTRDTVDQLKRIVRQYGVTLIATLHSEIVGGVICTRVGANFFMHVVAHDPTMDDLRLGKICCYLSICDAIERGAVEYNMLSGEYEYKYRFLGQRIDYYKFVAYRSNFSLLANFGEYMRNEIRGRGRRLKRKIRNGERNGSNK